MVWRARSGDKPLGNSPPRWAVLGLGQAAGWAKQQQRGARWPSAVGALLRLDLLVLLGQAKRT
ncbi:hypothetical protein B0E43_13190 [Algoriphagus sp. A40]|nr:hypothetical protein B0E43_13190 [Algoriphagus sp. A40]